MPLTITVELEDDDLPWLTAAPADVPIVIVEKKEWNRVVARSLRNFQLYLDASAAAMKERWRLEDEIERLRSPAAPHPEHLEQMK